MKALLVLAVLLMGLMMPAAYMIRGLMGMSLLEYPFWKVGLCNGMYIGIGMISVMVFQYFEKEDRQ